ncbi:MAG TPA: tRNA guanosine(34) transglycosylase Tgt [Actinobacteria bacterium]|nr:tRNA guanosine(34) transglycosylase Tgt [Actinomycetota bacterium]
MAVTWRLTARDGRARAGRLDTPHGPVETPAFMAVGTRGAVKTVDPEDLGRLGAEILLANAYHLMQRPGAEVVAELGGIQRFMGWDRPVLTDSGGYQVLSLAPEVGEEGLVFRSSYDGRPVFLDPEGALGVQETLGSDVAMALDVPVALPAPRDLVEAAMERTLRWAARTIAARRRGDRAVFGIVQGGVDRELRARSAAATAALGFEGYGIGGLAVGETPTERLAALRATIPELPTEAPRYVMGLGDPEGLLDAIGEGVDLFDCVLPTRLARHGKALTTRGDLSIRRAEFARDDGPLDPDCACPTCRHHSRGYLRHLTVVKDPTGRRLLTLHNLAYVYGLLAGAREAIRRGVFEEYRRRIVARRAGRVD